MMRIRQNRSTSLRLLLMGACMAIVLLLPWDLAAQCQMCRTALTQSPEGQRWSHGINAGIILLLATLFLIVGSTLLVIYHTRVLGRLRDIRARLAPAGAYRKARLSVSPLGDR
jgi:ABC-type Fe3+ transport system permease subunit